MNVLDEYRYPTYPTPAPASDEGRCGKCGAGAHCHEVRDEGSGVMSRQCMACSLIAYSAPDPDMTSPGSGVYEREMTEKPCKNCGDMFLAWKAKFCKDCKTVNARRRKRRAMAGMRGDPRETATAAEFEPSTV